MAAPLRILVPLLSAVVLAAGAAAPASGSPPGASAAAGTVRMTGVVLRTPAEPGHPARTGLRVGSRLVATSGAGIERTPAGAQVTVDVGVPAAAGSGGDRVAASIDAASRQGAPALAVQRVVSSTPPVAQAYTPATRALTMVNVTPRGATPDPIGTPALTTQVSASSTFWQQQSRGELRLAMSGALRPSYTASVDCSDPFALWDEAARRTGYVDADDSSLVLVLPGSAGCSYGLGTIGGSPNSGGYMYYSGDSPDVLSHEAGHNMSLMHADRLACPTADARQLGWDDFGTSCELAAYGDGQDIMSVDLIGSPSPMLSTPQALRTGMLEASAATVLPGTGTSSVTLLPVAGRTGLRSARVTNPATGVTYYVEYRRASGLDAENAWGHRTGMRVLRWNYDSTNQTVLLDPSPTGTWDDADPVLDVGETLTTYDGGLRFRTVSAGTTSATVEVVSSVTLRDFTMSAGPSVSGTRGVGRTLTANRGTWSPTPSSTSYRWLRDGVAISGAYYSTYTPRTADAGRYLSVRVTVRRLGYRDATATSSRVGIPIYATTAPRIGGTARVGRTLTAYVGSWTPTPSTYGYQWYRGSTAISGATAKTYVVRSSDVGAKIRARVTARRTGYSSGSAYTPYTAAVTR